MPMIDVYAAAGTFNDQHALAQKLATELMTIEQVPEIPMFRKTRQPSFTNSRHRASRTSTGTPPTCGSRSSQTPAPSIATSSSPL
jgi:hypothetical protein